MRKNFLLYAAIGALALIGATIYATGYAKAADKGGIVTRAEAEQMFPTNPWTAIYGSVDGYQFSGRLGGDVQINRIVLGILAQYGYDHVSLFGSTINPKEVLVAARAGVLITDTALLYGLAGETWLSGVSGLSTHGLTTGGGLEVAMTRNWRVGLEYNHTTYDALSTAQEQSVTARVIFAFPVR